MARDLIVRVVGDTSSLDRAFKKGARSAKNFDRSMRGTTLSVRGFQRSLGGLTAGLIGGAGLAVALRAVARETSEMQKVAAQTNAVIESTGGVAGVSAGHVDELAKSLLNLSGVDDELIKNSENLLLTFTNIRNVVGEGNDIFDQATLAALNLSARFGRDLSGSAITLGKALQDPEKGLLALRRSGVQFDEAQQKTIKTLVASGRLLEAQKVILAEVEKQTKGAAAAAGDTLAGKLNKLRENALNLGGALATTLLPVIEPLVDKMIAWFKNTKNQEQVMNTFKDVVAVVADVLDVLRGAFSALNEITGSTKNSLKILLGVLLAYKAIKIASVLAGFASSIGLIGTNARTASGQVAGLRGNLGKLAALGAIPVVIAVSYELSKQIRKIPWWEKEMRRGGGQIFDALDKLFGIGPDVRAPTPPVRPPAGARGPVGVAARGGAAAPGVVDPELAKQIAKQTRASREAFRQEQQERAGFAVERAAATATLADDLAALNRYNALLARRIRGGHATLELERQQFQVQQEIADVLKRQAEARAEQRETRQFRALGLGPGGADLVPSAEVLRKQLGSAEKALQGTFLDTKKTRSLAARIRKVLSGAMGAISEDVRSTIKRLIDDLRQMQEKSSVDVTRFQKTARGQFALAGAAGGGKGVVITGGVHLHGIQNVQQLEAALAKRKKQRARQRGSTR